MTTIFISHTQEDAACVKTMRKDLDILGYSVWRKPAVLSIPSPTQPRTLEGAILGSAAVILVWSRSAAQSEDVEKQTFLAQNLEKSIVPVVLDGTALPNRLASVASISSQVSCVDAAPHLLPLLPPVSSADPLIALWEKAAHNYIRIRKEAIDAAAALLQGSEHREAALAVLEYVANHDDTEQVKKQAQSVLDDEGGKPQSQGDDESRHTFDVACPKGHVTTFNKWRVCTVSVPVIRKAFDEDELILTCGTCGAQVVTRQDCRGYK